MWVGGWGVKFAKEKHYVTLEWPLCVWEYNCVWMYVCKCLYVCKCVYVHASTHVCVCGYNDFNRGCLAMVVAQMSQTIMSYLITLGLRNQKY